MGGFVMCVSTAACDCDAPYEPLHARGRFIQVAAGLDTMRHRGPVDEVLRTPDQGVTIGVRTLGALDSDRRSRQLTYPASGPHPDRWSVCFTGQLHNAAELREQLEREHGAQLSTAPASTGPAGGGQLEVVAAALDAWGWRAVRRFRGVFGYAVWDRVDRVLHAARDPFGATPLYYLWTGTGLWLASEKKALLAAVDRPLDTVDREAFDHYLAAGRVPEPLTMHTEVRQLPAGCRLCYSPEPASAPATVERYVRPTIVRPMPAETADRTAARAADRAARLRSALRGSIRNRLNPPDAPGTPVDRRVGAVLSGDLGSAAVIALAREVQPDLPVFTVGFDTDRYPERERLEDTATALGVRQVLTVVTAADVAAALPRIVWHLDDPVADPSVIPLYFLARTAGSRVAAVLSGDGAAELFSAPTELVGEPGTGRQPVAATTGCRPRTLASALRRLAAALPTTGNRQRPLVPLSDFGRDVLTASDRMSMAHSLELRLPFFDQAVFEAVGRPAEQLARGPAPQNGPPVRDGGLLAAAMRGIVADRVVDGLPGPTTVPIARWLRYDLRDWADHVLAWSGAGELIDLAGARQLLRAHGRGEADHARELWTALIGCLWYGVFIEHSIQPTADARKEPVTIAFS